VIQKCSTKTKQLNRKLKRSTNPNKKTNLPQSALLLQQIKITENFESANAQTE
jgi:hypothetical protein